MAFLNLTRSDGSTETRELSRSQPLTIGRQQFNDICVPEHDVAPFHCRISWNKKAFEVTAATSDGVEVNSHAVAHIDLKPGDLIRVGSLDLEFQDDSVPVKPVRDHIPLQAIAESIAPAPRKSKVKAEPIEKPVEDMSLYSGEIMTESQAMIDALFDEEEQKTEVKVKEVKRAEVLQFRQLRPGEQDVFRSPLVLGLTFGGLTLLLVTGIFWFLITREQASKLYERAVNESSDGQYAQSSATFEQFLAQYPSHSMHRQAVRGLAKALIFKEISGSAPAWKRGLEKLNDLIKAHRNESDFSELNSSLFQSAEQISLGAAKSAESARDPELLAVSKDAQVILERYADPAAPPVGSINRINEQRLKAERAIDKQNTFDQSMQTVDGAIAARKPMLALSERERLIKRFPEFLNSGRVKDSLQKALELERSVIVVDEKEQAAQTTDEGGSSTEGTLGLLLTRSRTDDVSQGRVVFVMAKDSCYAVDAVTGELVWRRVVGLDPPFFPVLTNGAQPSVLLFDTTKQALVSCQVSTGKLIWKQPLNARAIGAPLVHEGQIYQVAEGNQLVRIDLDTGRLSARAIFSQNLATTPALSRNGEYLLVPGQMAMIYSLTVKTTGNRQPLTAAAMTFTDHAAGSISAPPLSMGNLLLICENDQADSSKLRLWNATDPAKSLKELASARTDKGQVHDLPILRGNQLIVPSAGENFSAFAVTDDPERAGIAPIGQYMAAIQTKDQLPSPVFVSIGPDDQFWAAGSAFRKFEIAGGKIRWDSNAVAPGIASQPLQIVGDYFFVGRKSRYSDAVTFSTIEREKLVAPWRALLGDQPLEMAPTRDAGIVLVGESGTLYSLSKNRLSQPGIDMKAGVDLELPPNVSRPIRASLLHDQRLVVAASGDSTQLLLLNTSGQVVSKHPLDDLPEADPVLLDDGLVLPLPSRLKLLSLTAGKKPVMDWIAPVGDNVSQSWAHLVRIDGKELIAIDKNGLLKRIQLRQGDVPHLAEVAKLQLNHPVDVRPQQRDEFIYVADASGVCRQLNNHSFDTEGERTFTAPIRNLWAPGANLIVQAGDRKLYCMSDGKDLPIKWTFDLDRLEPVGPAIVNGETIWFACRNGTVLVLSSTTGKETRRMQLPQALSLGLRQVNEMLIAVGCDGTIYKME